MSRLEPTSAALVRTASVGALAAILLSAAVWGQQPLRLEIPAQELLVEREDWFGIYSDENKLGYLRNHLRRGETPDEMVVESEIHLKVITLGERREVRSREELVFSAAAPHDLLRGDGTIRQGEFEQQVQISPSGTAFAATIRAAGSERTMSIADLDFTLADILTPELWFRAERAPGEILSTRSFSLSDLTPALDTYRVESLKKTLVDGVQVTYYEVELHSSVAGELGTALIDDRGQLISGVLGGAFEIRRESAELAVDFDYAADVYLLGLAEVDTQLGDPRRIRSLRMEVHGEEPQILPTSSRQRVEPTNGSESWVLTTGSGAGQPLKATEEEISSALEETLEHPIRHDDVVKLAREVVGDASDRREQVGALVRFVDGFVVDSYSAEPLTVLDILQERRGDCTEHALLFTTLARAIGIPAREVTGLLYLGDDVQAFGGHAWNEVVIDGEWVPVDATWGEVEPNATHIRLGTRLGQDSSAASLFAGFSFTVLDVERD